MSKIGKQFFDLKMDTHKKVEIFTDGACSGNPGPGGYGVLLRHKSNIKELAGGYKLTTNNRMELMAATEALKALKEPCRVKLYSDSKYLVDAMTEGWALRWKANNWKRNKKEKAENVDLWEQLLELCKSHQVDFIWVKGHDGLYENERCDELSRNAIKLENLRIDYGYSAEQKTLFEPTSDTGINKSLDPVKSEVNGNCSIEMDGQVYVWDGERWYDSVRYTVPSENILNKLNSKLTSDLEKEDSEITDSNALFKRAIKAKRAKQLTRAEKLARRTLKLSHKNLGAIAILSSCLRSRGLPEQALRETEAFKNERFLPIIISRAAALCDLERWEKAKKEVSKALAIGRTFSREKNLEAFMVLGRIKAARPDLYPKKE